MDPEAREYRSDLDQLPLIGAMDWELAAEVEELLDSRRVPASSFDLFAHDAHGAYMAPNVESLRQKALQEPEPPHTVHFIVAGREESGYTREFQVVVRTHDSDWGPGFLQSSEYELLEDLRGELTAAYERAAHRHPAPGSRHDPTSPAFGLPPDTQNSVAAVHAPSRTGLWTRAGRTVYDHILKAVISGVLIIVISGLILHYVFGLSP